MSLNRTMIRPLVHTITSLSHYPLTLTRRTFTITHYGRAAAGAVAPQTMQAASASVAVPSTASTPVPTSSKPAAAPIAPRSRPAVTSAQLRAQRPRATEKVAANPDTALSADKCGPEQVAPEMVNVVNATTGERLGPRGLEPTRYGDWEAKGRCWDF